MKVNEPPPIQPSRTVGSGRSVPPADSTGGSGDDAPHPEQEDHGEEHDIAAVHGIDTEDLTPSVQEALVKLIAEVSELREALERSNKRLHYLTTLADQDSVSALLNRRAFVRELSRALVLTEKQELGSTLVFLEIENMKDVNIDHGMAAGDAAIEHIAGLLQEQFGDGAAIGRLSGAEFGVVLLGEAAAAAQLQALELSREVASRPLVWDGSDIALAVTWGVHSLQSGEDAVAAMNAADREMRRSQNA